MATLDRGIALPAPDPVPTGTFVSGESTTWLLAGEVG